MSALTAGWAIRDVRSAAFRTAVLLVALYGIFFVDNFASSGNIKALLSAIAIVGIAAVGVSFVTLSGNIFMLSVAATMAASSILVAQTMGDIGLVPAILVTVLIGAVIGGLQGFVVGRMGGDPIITTIAFSSLILGAGQWYAGGETIRAGRDVSVLRSDVLSFVPIEGLVFIVIAVLAGLALTYTRFGHHIKLVGENSEAARLAGLPVTRITLYCYAIAGALAAIAAIFLSARSGQGTLDTGAGIDFDVIAVILVAGVAVTGGRGSIFDVALGALFIGMVSNLLAVQGASFEMQLFVKGVIVLVALVAAGVVAKVRGERA